VPHGRLVSPTSQCRELRTVIEVAARTSLARAWAGCSWRDAGKKGVTKTWIVYVTVWQTVRINDLMVVNIGTN